MSLWAAITSKGPSGFGYASTAEEVTRGLDLSGQTILLTGCNSGIGHESLRVLSMRGAHVIAAARTVEKAATACASMTETTPVACELSEPDSVKACIASVKELGRPLDAIICNAGIMALPKLQQKCGYELQFFTNHIGHFMLVTGLLDQLADAGRVVMVSSDAHKAAPDEGIQFDNLSGEHGYHAWKNYGQSKLANLLFARELARRFEGTDKTANGVHPGVIKTKLSRNMNPLVGVALAIANPLALKSIPQGAATQVWAATHPATARTSGEYLSHCNVATSTRNGQDMDMAKKLWDVSEQIVADL